MENKKLLTKKVRAVAIAAMVGAALSVLLIVVDNWVYDIWGHGLNRKPWADFFLMVGYVLAIPTAVLSKFVGVDSIWANAYLVNGFLGAIVMAIFTAFWQFYMKGDNEE